LGPGLFIPIINQAAGALAVFSPLNYLLVYSDRNVVTYPVIRLAASSLRGEGPRCSGNGGLFPVWRVWTDCMPEGNFLVKARKAGCAEGLSNKLYAKPDYSNNWNC